MSFNLVNPHGGDVGLSKDEVSLGELKLLAKHIHTVLNSISLVDNKVPFYCFRLNKNLLAHEIHEKITEIEDEYPDARFYGFYTGAKVFCLNENKEQISWVCYLMSKKALTESKTEANEI
jgi:hypothetical protein